MSVKRGGNKQKASSKVSSKSSKAKKIKNSKKIPGTKKTEGIGNTGNKYDLRTIPLGIKVLMIYSLILASLNLVFAFVLDNALILGLNLSGFGAKILYVLSTILLLILVWGYLKGKRWGFYYALLWYILSIVDSLISLFSLQLVNLSSTVFLVFILMIMLLNGLTLGYVSMKKEYFSAPKKIQKLDYEDKLFIGILSIFLITLLALTIFGGYLFFLNAKTDIDLMSIQLNNKNVLEAEILCAAQVGQNADICYLVLANSVNGDKRYCDYIQTGFYRYVCSKSTGI